MDSSFTYPADRLCFLWQYQHGKEGSQHRPTLHELEAFLRTLCKTFRNDVPSLRIVIGVEELLDREVKVQTNFSTVLG